MPRPPLTLHGSKLGSHGRALVGNWQALPRVLLGIGRHFRLLELALKKSIAEKALPRMSVGSGQSIVDHVGRHQVGIVAHFGWK